MAVLPGTLFPTANPTPPAASSGWLPARGGAYSRTTYAGLFEAITIKQSAQITNGSNVVSNLTDTSYMDVGHAIEATGIPAGATIASIASSTSVTISANATQTNAVATIRVLPHGRGDGSTTFNVPDPRGRAIIGAGQGTGLTARGVGKTGGAETHTLSIGEMPAHTHTLTGLKTNQPSNTNSGTSIATSGSGSPGGNVDSRGGDGAHNNMQPWLAVHWIIK
jgi:hypothetical protein